MEVANGVTMSVGSGGANNRENAVVSGGGNIDVGGEGSG